MKCAKHKKPLVKKFPECVKREQTCYRHHSPNYLPTTCQFCKVYPAGKKKKPAKVLSNC